ncbi:hypothetical protein PR202_gb24571 [Eleusine coracana subsp. coracana]|uniref:Uncharacterized protein n=1 Tax=Eleusine coracana subsp. coracana TaxID=191504 RepID=A0AAV5FM03_ELECO|nr:hypothetical protein PR202_gb24571 [Eleusine coracana subsp. coracana]
MGSSPRWWSASPPSPWARVGAPGKWWALGGPAVVKAVGCLLLAGITFRMLCSYSSPSQWAAVSEGVQTIDLGGKNTFDLGGNGCSMIAA